jgi:aminopeptidase N
MNKTRPLLVLCTVLLVACQAAPESSAPKTSSGSQLNPLQAAWDDYTPFKAGLVASQQPVVDKLHATSVYHIDFTLNADLVHVQGQEEVRYTNQEDVALGQVYFHLFPNVLGGEMTVSGVTVDGQPVTTDLQARDSVLQVPFDSALQPGQSRVIRLDFAVTVPTQAETNYGVLVSSQGVLTLAHSYPMVAVYDRKGWNIEIPPENADPTYGDTSFFLVRVTAPKEVVLVGTGIEADVSSQGDRQVVTFASGPARDFFLAASARYQQVSQQFGEVRINSYSDSESKPGAQRALDVAAQAIKDFSQRYAPYPYTEFDIAATPLLAWGVEYPGLTAINQDLFDLSASTDGTPNSVYLEATVAHEVGHQWFYNLVGNDQINEPWLDEALTQYVTWQFYKDIVGTDAAHGFEQSLQARWESVERADIPIGLPASDYQGKEYGAIVYGRGPLFFDALEQQVGQSTFDQFLQDYTQAYAWGIATGADLQTLAEQDCACDLTPLFQQWIYP